MRSILLAAALLLSAPAYADAWFTGSIASFHQERGRYNEFNPGVGFEYGGTIRLVGGAYRNSLSRNTLYAGARYTPLTVGPFAVGTIFAIASGYSSHLMVAPVPVISYEGKHYGANLLVVPPLVGKSGVLGLQLKARF